MLDFTPAEPVPSAHGVGWVLKVKYRCVSGQSGGGEAAIHTGRGIVEVDGHGAVMDGGGRGYRRDGRTC